MKRNYALLISMLSLPLIASCGETKVSPVESTPAESTPAESTPAESTPADNSSADSTNNQVNEDVELGYVDPTTKEEVRIDVKPTDDSLVVGKILYGLLNKEYSLAIPSSINAKIDVEAEFGATLKETEESFVYEAKLSEEFGYALPQVSLTEDNNVQQLINDVKLYECLSLYAKLNPMAIMSGQGLSENLVEFNEKVELGVNQGKILGKFSLDDNLINLVNQFMPQSEEDGEESSVEGPAQYIAMALELNNQVLYANISDILSLSGAELPETINIASLLAQAEEDEDVPAEALEAYSQFTSMLSSGKVRFTDLIPDEYKAILTPEMFGAIASAYSVKVESQQGSNVVLSLDASSLIEMLSNLSFGGDDSDYDYEDYYTMKALPQTLNLDVDAPLTLKVGIDIDNLALTSLELDLSQYLTAFLESQLDEEDAPFSAVQVKLIVKAAIDLDKPVKEIHGAEQGVDLIAMFAPATEA